jgi:uncharacterized protein (TIGR02453 family)
MKELISFFSDLEQNNNRDWFNENKPRFEHVKSLFLNEVQSIIDKLQLTDPQLSNLDAKHTVFRIYRDVRFSKDKRPYKTHIGAYMAKVGIKARKAGRACSGVLFRIN